MGFLSKLFRGKKAKEEQPKAIQLRPSAAMTKFMVKDKWGNMRQRVEVDVPRKIARRCKNV
jgi:hypothetical protein